MGIKATLALKKTFSFLIFTSFFFAFYSFGQKIGHISLDKINSAFDEQNPIVSPDGQRLYFTRSGHPRNEGGVIDRGDIWYSERDSLSWSEPKHGGSTINHKGLNGIIGFSANGERIYLINYMDNTGLIQKGITMSEWVKDHWSIPQPLNIRFFSNSSEYISGTISIDEKVMILSMKSFDNYGNEDLYVTQRQDDGNWSEPQNLGIAVNTYAEEWSPFLAGDMETLYFSSNGQETTGGREIYKTRRRGASWTNWEQPINLGSTINTSGTELGYFMPYKGDLAYFSSTQNSQGFGDIFAIKLDESAREVQKETLIVQQQEIEKEPAFSVITMTMQVLDALWEKPIDAVVTLMYGNKATEINTAEVDSPEKKFLITMPEGTEVNVEISAEGYLNYKESFTVASISERSTKTSTNVEGFRLTPKVIGTKVKIENVLFEEGSATFSNKEISLKNLDGLVALLEANPAMEIRLEGHTDNRGNPILLKELSLKRVDAVKEYITSKGINSARVETIGYGAENPVGRNSTDKGRGLNRRVEFVIIK
jgi:outer membrane protein OmpA-like peptidoglycan-associated protein